MNKTQAFISATIMETGALTGADPADLPMKITSLHSVEMFPPIHERSQWEKLGEKKENQMFRKQIISEAEKLLDEPIQELPASKFMEFVTNGNRRRFEDLYFARRSRLTTLFLAEAFEYKGRFTIRMIDELWAILNEPTWCLPAHRSLGYRDEKELPPQPDPLAWFDYEPVDLFSAQTSAVLSTVYRMAGKELSAVSSGLVRRLKETLYDRSIRSMNTTSHYWWTMGGNNWTSWVCCNLLITANNLLQDDPEQLTGFVRKYLQVYMDRYEKRYIDDGGGREGPNYWAVSMGRAMAYYELLYCQSEGKCSLYDSPKIRRMGEYIADAMFGPDAVVSFADCPPNPGNFPAGRTTRFAERIDSEKLLTFCQAYRNATPHAVKTRGFSCIVCLEDLFYEKSGPGEFRSNFCTWYPLLEQLFVHSGRLGFAAKGGNNRELHNHNDVGQFMLAADGEIYLADVGSNEYTKDTFNANRYTLPNIGFQYHNAPIFDGIGEQVDATDKTHTRNLKFEERGDDLFLTMDIVEFYPAELRLVSCKRTFVLDRETNSLTVTDEWQAEKPVQYSLTIFTTTEWGKGPYTASSSCPAKCVRFDITEPGMKRNWKELWQTTILADEKALSGKCTLKFTLVQK